MLAGEFSSQPRPPFVRRPTIDNLVAIARASGKTNAQRHTIRYWVTSQLLDKAVRVGRGYGYPLRAVGQADCLARWSVRANGLPMVRLALFIETNSIPPEEALAIAAKRTALWKANIEEGQLDARDPELLRREVVKAARQRGPNSVLPRAVRMSLDERTAAVAELAAIIFDARIPGVPPGWATWSAPSACAAAVAALSAPC